MNEYYEYCLECGWIGPENVHKVSCSQTTPIFRGKVYPRADNSTYKGWECPKCRNIWAPWMPECPNCNSGPKEKSKERNITE